ncbi:hypothetical protein EDB85DRAFT_994532 [Lactarius pseudohatsudake]|nr:hypothetical protein EDB85DRAFT_994532 [Lactarius pseudohatsudake]
MSTTDPEPGQISQVVFSIVSKGRENKSLSSLTPRLVRNEVEKELGLPKNTLDVPKYKDIVKRAINDAMQSEQTPGASASRDRKTGKTGSIPKAGQSGGRSSLSKSAKSKEVISDSDSAVEPTSRSNVKLDMSAHAVEVLRVNPSALVQKQSRPSPFPESQSAVRRPPRPHSRDRSASRVSKRGGDKDKIPDDASDQDSESASDRQQPVVNNARKSIMAFLQDQSSDDD